MVVVIESFNDFVSFHAQDEFTQGSFSFFYLLIQFDNEAGLRAFN